MLKFSAFPMHSVAQSQQLRKRAATVRFRLVQNLVPRGDPGEQFFGIDPNGERAEYNAIDFFGQLSSGQWSIISGHVFGASFCTDRRRYSASDFLKERHMAYASRSGWTSVVTALVVLTSFTGMLWAQGGTGELSGLVTDPSGAVVAGAKVTLANSATGEQLGVTTTSAGTYRFGALQVVGAYALEIEAKGFKSYRIENVIISVGAVTTHDATLAVGGPSESITVEAGVQQVHTTESSLSGLIDRHVWQNMPLETRSQNEFIELLPGAEPAKIAQLGEDRGAAVNGTRSGSGNFLVEGFDNNDQFLGGAGSSEIGPGGASTTIDPDAIQEYRVIEHIPPAEYGKAGGFVTDTVLKSGTNQWHGSLFEYNRVQALAANSWFSNNAGEQDHLVRNQFGGSVGGPVVKDKTFFFFTTEAHRMRESSPLTVPTITPDFVNFVQTGAFEQYMESNAGGFCELVIGAACPGAFAQDATTGPLWQKIYAAEPLPLCNPEASNCTNLTMGGQSLYTGGVLGLPAITYPVNVYGTLTVTQPDSINQMRYTGKFDQKLGGRDQLNAAYLYDNADTVEAYGGNSTMGPTLYEHIRGQNVGVTWSHIFSPTILNQARVAYVRHTGNFPGDPSVLGMPDITTYWDTPFFGFGNADNYPQFFTDNEFQYKDDLSLTRGKHNFKSGAEYRRTRNGSSFESWKYGELEPQGTEDLLTDMTFSEIADNLVYGAPTFGSLANAEASLNPATGQLPIYYRGYRANEFAFYFQDDWRIGPRLTLNLGLRWEYFGPPHNFQPGLDSNFYTGVYAPFTNPCLAPGGSCTGPTPDPPNPFMPTNSPYYGAIATGTVQQRNHDIWNKDFHNFGPRVGFAWDTWGTGKLVVRGGFGINYDRIYNNVFENIRFNPPAFALGLLGPFGGNGNLITPAQTTALYTYPFTGTSTFAGAGLTPSLRDMDQNIVTPYYEQANLGFEYQLGKDFVLESNYVGTFGHKLIGITGANLFDGEYAYGLDTTPINPNYSTINLRSNCCDSNYHAWQTSVRKRFANGLQFNVNYTFSKAMDDISDAFYTKNNSNDYPTDSMNPHFDYGPADFDVRHRFVASFVYEMPFAKQNRWLGGWNVSGIVSVQTGATFSVTNSTVDSNGDGQYNDRAVYLGPGALTSDIHHNVSPAAGYLTGDVQMGPTEGSNPSWGMLNGYNSTDPQCPPTVNMGLWCQGKTLGQMERNTLVGPGYVNTDLGFGKSFKITESSKLTFEGNFFNIFNHPNFLLPDTDLNDVGTFGKSLATFVPGPGGARVTQLALRFDF
jgi:hypothetical protein